MYEHLRNDFAIQLGTIFGNGDVDKICSILDRVVNGYEIKERETALALYEDDFPQVAKIYLASKKLEGLSSGTLELYGGRLRIFFETVGKKPEDVTTNDIRLFLATYQQNNKISDRTLDKFRQIISGFFTWLVDEDYIVKNPCRNINDIKFEIVPRKALTRFELEIIRRACKTKRELAIVDVLYSTGCRVSELVNMERNLLNRTDASIEIVGKGKKHNVVYFNTNAQLSLAEYLEEREDNSKYLFVSYLHPFDKLSTKTIQAFFRRLSEETGIDVTPHIMRHTSATLALQSGMDLAVVQKMLGHANINTTRIYAETSNNEVMTSHRKYVI